jgi:hypothetical protein
MTTMLTHWDYEDTVERVLDVPPARALEGVMGATFRDVPLATVLLFLRGLPVLVRRRRLPDLDRSFYRDLLATPGFVELSRDDRAIWAGYVGRPWTPSGGGRTLTAAGFEAFDEPGYVKAVTDFVAEPRAGHTVLSTTTRIHLTDERARRRFRFYWLAVHPGSLAVRHSWLAGAERWAARSGPSPAPAAGRRSTRPASGGSTAAR